MVVVEEAVGECMPGAWLPATYLDAGMGSMRCGVGMGEGQEEDRGGAQWCSSGWGGCLRPVISPLRQTSPTHPQDPRPPIRVHDLLHVEDEHAHSPVPREVLYE